MPTTSPLQADIAPTRIRCARPHRRLGGVNGRRPKPQRWILYACPVARRGACSAWKPSGLFFFFPLDGLRCDCLGANNPPPRIRFAITMSSGGVRPSRSHVRRRAWLNGSDSHSPRAPRAASDCPRDDATVGPFAKFSNRAPHPCGLHRVAREPTGPYGE